MRHLPKILAIVFAGLLGCADEAPDFDPANGQSIMDQASCGEEPATCPGSSLPSVELEDFQPQSTQFETVVNLHEFKGQPLLVALLASW